MGGWVQDGGDIAVHGASVKDLLLGSAEAGSKFVLCTPAGSRKEGRLVLFVQGAKLSTKLANLLQQGLRPGGYGVGGSGRVAKDGVEEGGNFFFESLTLGADTSVLLLHTPGAVGGARLGGPVLAMLEKDIKPRGEGGVEKPLGFGNVQRRHLGASSEFGNMVAGETVLVGVEGLRDGGVGRGKVCVQGLGMRGKGSVDGSCTGIERGVGDGEADMGPGGSSVVGCCGGRGRGRVLEANGGAGEGEEDCCVVEVAPRGKDCVLGKGKRGSL